MSLYRFNIASNFHNTFYILFDDPIVKLILLSIYDDNNDKLLTLKDTSHINSFNLIFYNHPNKAKIKSLRVLQYFTNVEIIINDEFRGLTNLKEIWLPPSIKQKYRRIFLETPNIENVIFTGKPFIPAPEFHESNGFFNRNTYNQLPVNLHIYVPDFYYNDYKELWKDYKYVHLIYPMSEYRKKLYSK